MKTILAKTFGGLDKAYYFRQLFFGALLPAFVIFMTSQSPTAKPIPVSAMFYLGLNTLLYPYSKFVWDTALVFCGQAVHCRDLLGAGDLHCPYWISVVVVASQ